MAALDDRPSASHDTALCFIPPRDQWHTVDTLRYSNDKGYGNWPPHINVVYPFVSRRSLQETLGRITSSLEKHRDVAPSVVPLSLNSPGSFSHKQGGTLYVHDDDPMRLQGLHGLRKLLLEALHWQGDGVYRMHMTVAQCEEPPGSDKHHFLLEKVKMLPPVAWEAHQLAVLVRNEETGCMEVHGHIDLKSLSVDRHPRPLSAYDIPASETFSVEPRPSYHFSAEQKCWQTHTSRDASRSVPEHLVIASYNVLAEFQWPPRSVRYPIIISNLLAATAKADAIVLQEVTDDFLPHLLSNEDIRLSYPFSTHASPNQLNVGPLPSILNVVVLSRHSFTWSHLPFQRRHKGCCIVTFDNIGEVNENGQALPLMLAATHLSQGLNDGAVAAKRGELQRILNYMLASYPHNMWVLAGDFNMATSSYTLDTALKNGAISKQTRASLERMDAMIREAGLCDAWVAARIEAGESSDDIKQTKSLDDVFEGEQGATFDPRENPISAAMVGSGFNNRPQRYDRIFVKGASTLTVGGFNMFGFMTTPASPEEAPEVVLHASDHWGIRCLLRKSPASVTDPTARAPTITVVPTYAPSCLSDTDMLKECLYRRQCLPTAEEEKVRGEAFDLLRVTILGDATSDHADATSERFPTVLVPVGSYGLGVWTQDSDLDCFCIGSFSPATFFRLARQRIATSKEDIRVLRKVKAKSGTMLILEVRGVKADLQYCQAPHIAEAWPDVMKRPPSDPAFNLKFESLLKLKPARDLFYLRRSIPDLAQFRVAYQLIKEWSKTRGIYGARFGYLGGIHLSVLLVRICKMLSHEGSVVSAADIVMTFFDHYAGFDWHNQVVSDPFFHKVLRYDRTYREPLCLVGWHPPVLNTAMAASKPTVKTLENEFKIARDRLLTSGIINWAGFLGEHQLGKFGLSAGAKDFLVTYKSYIKMDIRYWGSSHAKGCKLVGWLESRCVSVLVDLGLKLPGLLARIWPHRFSESQSEDLSTSGHYQAAYLIGLDWDKSVGGPTSGDGMRSAQETLQAIMQQFERRIQGDEVYFDPQRSLFQASLVRASELSSMSLDKQDWGEYQSDDDDSDDELDDIEAAAPEHFVQSTRRSKASGKSPLPAKIPPKPEGAPKLRTAADVLHRLRWDPGMRSDDFVIGYADRHLPEPQEKALEAWKSEQTHEEFIPQHRILYFKRKTDGVLVWERSTRTDQVFGTGY